MSKETYKKRIEDYRKKMVSLRANVDKLKEEKKKRIEVITRQIKNTTSKNSKETYRKNKISTSAKYDRDIESVKKKIEALKKDIDKIRKLLANVK
ncbi:MAG: hypothetical protein Q4G08_11430 [Capnocytophaga sp.]|nr:hypothetical protein [Capnocytophaga sp.]MDO5609053.1 hypothetical protein [Capnocytophaga sp.]